MKFFRKKKQGDVQIIESLVCYCFRIPKKEIVGIIKKHKCRTVEAVQMYCSACEGCGGCRPDIEDLIEECSTKKEQFMVTLNWQTIARQQLDQFYQTDIYPLDVKDVLVAVLPEPEKLDDKNEEQQIKLIEDIRTLLLTKLEDHTEEISLPEETDAITFERTKIVDNFRDSRMRFAAWLNAQAPLASKNSIAFISTKTIPWEYMAEDLVSNDDHNLSVTFKIKVSINHDKMMFLIENWLRRQDIIHVCEINEIFDMYLTSIGFDGIIGSHDSEEVLENLIVQRKLQKKLNHSLHFFHNYGFNVEINQLKWETDRSENKPESLTAKIEKNRKESPLDNMRYDRLQINDIMDENRYDEHLDKLKQERSSNDEMISQITSTRRIKKKY